MKNKIPKISVVLPVYNGERFLKECVNSILNQTFKDFEFIIINDGSKDNTLKILKEFKKEDKRIILIDKKKNGGSSEALNTGLRKAKGKYVACFCADDISHKSRLGVEFNYLEKKPHIFLVGSSCIYVDEVGKEIRRFRKYDNYKIIAWRLRRSCNIILPSIMFRNEEVSFDKNFIPADDYNFYFELVRQGKNLTNIPNFLVKYRVHGGSISISSHKKQIGARDRIRENFKKLKDNTNFFNKVYYSLILFFHYIRTMHEKKII